VSAVDDRAEQIYAFLAMNQGQRFTLGQLCEQLGIMPGAKTTTAIRRARDLAAADGLHFPPAVPQNQHTYTVTGDAIDAIAPAVQMSRIAQGVERRAEVGYEFAEAGADELPPLLRIAVVARQETARETARYKLAMDNLVSDVAEAMRRERAASNGR